MQRNAHQHCVSSPSVFLRPRGARPPALVLGAKRVGLIDYAHQKLASLPGISPPEPMARRTVFDPLFPGQGSEIAASRRKPSGHFPKLARFFGERRRSAAPHSIDGFARDVDETRTETCRAGRRSKTIPVKRVLRERIPPVSWPSRETRHSNSNTQKMMRSASLAPIIMS
jgi:hypothetical protein